MSPGGNGWYWLLFGPLSQEEFEATFFLFFCSTFVGRDKVAAVNYCRTSCWLPGKNNIPAKTLFLDAGVVLQGKGQTDHSSASQVFPATHKHARIDSPPLPVGRSIDQVLSRLPGAVVDRVLEKTELAGYFDSRYRVTAEDEPYDDYRGYMLVSERGFRLETT